MEILMCLRTVLLISVLKRLKNKIKLMELLIEEMGLNQAIFLETVCSI